MKLTLEPYQELLRDHFLTHDRGAGFCGLGLGKTAATLSAIHENLLDGVSRATLVVAPLRVARLTWPNEVAKWDQFKSLRVESIRGKKPSGKAQLYVTNYERLGEITDLSWCDCVVFDELTRAKNPQSLRINGFRPLMKEHRRWGLTGTPRPNSLLEVFAQVRLLDDGLRLSPSFNHFRNTYFAPEDWNEYRWNPKTGAEEKIYRKIHDLALTLKSSDYLDIADTIVEDVEIPLPKGAHAIYAELERELLVRIGDGEVVAINAAVLVNKLLQICGGTVYNETRGVIDVHGSKIVALKKVLLDLGDERALIFTNYIHERERVVREIPGAVDASKFKGDIEDAWNSGKIRHLVADPRSLGHGLNLQQGGCTVIWYSPTWSRELYDQANARIARKGQDKVPQVFRLICTGTMDDVVIETLRSRGDEQGAMLDLLTNFRKMGRIFS